MLKIYSAILVLGLFLTSLFSANTVRAQDATMAAQMFKLTVNVTNTQNNKISGSIAMDNQTSKSFDNMSLILKLIAPGKKTEGTVNGQTTVTKVEPGLTVKYSEVGPFSIGPGLSKTENFEMAYPATIDTGTYSLVVEALDQASNSQGISSSPIALEGSGSFLSIDLASCKIQVGEEVYAYFEGPNIDSTQTGTASCAVTNPSANAVQGRLNFIYAVNSVSKNQDSLNKITQPELTTFEPNQKKTVTFVLPKELQSQVYEGLFELTDQSGQQISPDVPFRWIVTGPSATISNLSLDKTYYKKDEIAKVKVTVLPSADLGWRGSEDPFSPDQGTDLSNAKLSLRLLDKNGEVCGEKIEDLPNTKDDPYWDTNQQIDIPVTRNCLDPKLEAKVLADGAAQPLAELNIQSTSTDSDLASGGIVGQAGLNKLPMWAWVVIVLVIIGIIGGIIYWRKKRDGGGLPPAKPGSTSGVSPAAATTTASVLVLMIIGVLSGDVNPKLVERLHLEIPVAYAINTVKQPVNSADENIRTLTMQERRDNRDFWGNARDFSQNNTGGDSSVTITGSCDKVNITIKGTSKSNFACENWAPGLAILSEIDGQPMMPGDLSSAIGDEVTHESGTMIDVHRYGNDGQREVSYTLTPTGNQKIGTHKLSVKVGISLSVKHASREIYTNSFENLKNCDTDQDGPCYILLEHDLACKPPPSCNESCTTTDECSKNTNGCVECRPSATGGGNTCQPPRACNETCASDLECSTNTGGCTQCRPAAGGINTCQPPPACNEACATTQECLSNKQGCIECRPDTTGKNTCQPPPPACSAACSTDKDCFGNKQGCTLCLEGVCQPPASCGTACTTDKTCETAKDGCTQCVSGTCRIPPACGTACTTKADCSGARDNCSECLEGTCTDFNDNMCKCDGMVADITYPSNAFNFEAFGKVEGADVGKAEIADVTFRLTKDNQVIAKSNPITPTVVESTAAKRRVKATWSTPPPPVSKGSTYRVFADVRCKPKRITAVTDASVKPAPVAEVFEPKPPVALSWIMSFIDSLAKSENWKGRAIVGNVMAQLASPSPNADSNLQLKTLNFVKLLDTDNCRFVMFKYDETLF